MAPGLSMAMAAKGTPAGICTLESNESIPERTVVAMGTQAQTSVLHTAGAAALRGFKVIVPVDGMAADEVFPELYTAWHLATAARISPQVTLTKFDLIGF